MPELVDIEGWKRYANRFARGGRVEAVHVPRPDLLRATTPQGLGAALGGRTLVDHRRRGKWLIAETDGPSLVLHFGMTGELAFTEGPRDAHPHDCVVLDLDIRTLVYRSQRRFGMVALVRAGADPATVTGELGPDADEVDRDRLAELLGSRRGQLKSALMDQSLVAGLGNELSDEILWRAHLHPRRTAADLDGSELDDLHRAVHDVIADAEPHGHIPEASGWLESVRGDDDPRCPRCGAPIERVAAAGRTAYVCAAEQR